MCWGWEYSQVSSHHPLCSGDTEALTGSGLQPQAVDLVTMALAEETGEPLKLTPIGVLPWKGGKALKREPWVGGEAWASPLPCPDGLMVWAGPASLWVFLRAQGAC